MIHNNGTLDKKVYRRFGSRYHRIFIEYQKQHESALVDSKMKKLLNIELENKNIENLEQSSKTSSNMVGSSSTGLNGSAQVEKNYYIVTAYDEQPYIFIEQLSLGHESDCSLGMICYETDSIQRFPREFFRKLHKNGKTSINTSVDEEIILKNFLNLNEHYGVFEKRCCYGISISILNLINERLEQEGQEKLKFYLYVLKQQGSVTNKAKKQVNQSTPFSLNVQFDNLGDEVVYDLYTNQADLSIAPLSINREREKYVDFATEFYHDNYVIIGKRNPGTTSLVAFLAPFEWSMWLGVFFTLNIAALVETFYEWHSPYGLTPRGRDRREVWSLASALTLCWSVIFSHTFKTKSPKCWSNRFLGNLWGCFAVIFIASYTANLAAVMVGSRRIYQIKGITDPILSENVYKIGIIANSSAEQFLQTSRHYSHLYSNAHKNRYRSVALAVQALNINSIDFLILEHSVATYYILKSVNRSLEIIGDTFGRLAFSFALPKESSIFSLISNKLLIMQNDSTIERSLKDWFMDWKCEKDQNFKVLFEIFNTPFF